MNNDSGEFIFSAVRNKRAQHSPGGRLIRPAYGRPDFSTPQPQAEPGSEGEPRKKSSLDPWRVVAALKARWRWLAIGAAALAAAGFFHGFLRASFHSSVTLISRDAANGAVGLVGKDGLQPRQFTPQTLVSLMNSPELAERVAAKAQPPVSAGSLRERAQIQLVSDTELVALTLAGKNRRELVILANLFANEAVELGRELQTAESRGLAEFCAGQLTTLDLDIQRAGDEFVKFQNAEKLADPDAERAVHIKQLGDIMARADNLRIEAGMLDLQVTALQNELAQQNPAAQKLQAAKSKLADLLTRLTEAHPFVQGQRKEIAELEKQLASTDPKEINAARFTENSIGSALYMRLVETQTKKTTLQKELTELDKLKAGLQEKVTGLSEKATRYANLKARLDGLQKSRVTLAARQGEVELFQKNAQGYYRVFAPATEAGINSRARWTAGLKAMLAGAVIGLLGMGLVIAGAEKLDGRLKTAADVERVTGLPVLASLGDLNSMSAEEKEAWAFRTWTALAGQLNSSPNRGMVCGFIASSAGEGCSTWVKLLVDAANRRGLRAGVMTAKHDSVELETVEPVAAGKSTGEAKISRRSESEITMAVTAKPAATEISTAPAQAHIPLPGSVWSLEHRKEWQNALARWRAVDQLVVLVDLPPASVPEAVLLAENMPQLIWLADSGKARARATREQLKTLRHAGCRVAGAVLNHEPKPVFEL